MLTRRAAALDVLLVLLTAIVVPFGVEIAAAVVLVQNGEPDPASTVLPSAAFLMIQVWFHTVLALGLLGYLILRHRLPSAAFGLRFDDLPIQGLWTAGGLAAVYFWLLLTAFLLIPLMSFLPEVGRDVSQRQKVFELMPMDSLARTVLLMIPVAVNEEIIFRGLLLPLLKRLTGTWLAAIALTTGLFAVLHFTQGLIAVVQIVGVGVVLSVLFVRTRSLLVCMVTHFLFNVTQVQLMRMLQHLDGFDKLLG